MSEMTGQQMESFRNALREAFTLNSLDEMLLFRLDKHRAHIIASSDMNTVLFQLIRTAKRDGWLDNLVMAASEYNPGNPALKEFLASYLAARSDSVKGNERANSAGQFARLVDVAARKSVMESSLRRNMTMIEVLGIPVLMKAVDFLFDEGHKILQVRRERKRAELQLAENLSTSKTKDGIQLQTKEIPSNSIQTKTEILHQKISEAAWLAHESEVQHLLSLAEINSRNYRLAKEQYAKWGSALVPPIIVNNLQEAEGAVADTMRKLQLTLNKISDRPIVIPELEEEQ